MNTVMPTTIRMPLWIWCRVWPTLWRTEGMEEQTGFILSNSPTQTVGYYPVSELAKVPIRFHCSRLRKQNDFRAFRFHERTGSSLYAETGRFDYQTHLRRWQTDSGFYPWRWWSGGNITHNIPAFLNVPLTIPHKERLVITGESFIPTNDFERLKDTLRDGNGKPYKNGRNFASGSVRSLDPKNCIGRCVRFFRSMY